MRSKILLLNGQYTITYGKFLLLNEKIILFNQQYLIINRKLLLTDLQIMIFKFHCIKKPPLLKVSCIIYKLRSYPLRY